MRWGGVLIYSTHKHRHADVVPKMAQVPPLGGIAPPPRLHSWHTSPCPPEPRSLGPIYESNRVSLISGGLGLQLLEVGLLTPGQIEGRATAVSILNPSHEASGQ